ncbi:hypothetical protein OEA41_006946 [Lepraria neglecta]|uniref:Mog1p/PsbP-like protein n=1 Tax=Lepraria neglecta TaxID=209136 RepID=A0AAD9Z8X2_9LECA|nr:hypothetical protein OEA41_006946 [Lepraria neglecta]
MVAEFKHTELFGGAITANLPSDFADVSTIRQVPDNQEVYLEANGFTSLTIDLTERVTQFSTDKEALEYHLADIIAEGDTKQIVSVFENVQLSKFPPNTPVLSLIATTRPPPPGPGAARRPHAPTNTDIHLTLIRLVEQSTDIVITLNVPHIPSETEAEDPAAGDGDAVRKQLNERTERAVLMKETWEMVVGSVEIRDWSLFGTE